MKRALIAAALLAASPAWAIDPPTEAEIAEQRRIVPHLLDRINGRRDLVPNLAAWFGREFQLECERREPCAVYVIHRGAGREISYFRLVIQLPEE
ncbi:hypothetical protein [Massilia sp. METH4]|uniref:hypothetical protein n=1 Tax=Massilia sp. METH4 TaxID=3123041 RepID=UPI0030D19306